MLALPGLFPAGCNYSVMAHRKCTTKKRKKREVTAKMKPINIVGLVILSADMQKDFIDNVYI